MALTDSTDDNLPVLEPGLVFKIVVPRDRIELSTPGFSVGQTDVRGCPLSSIIVFGSALTTPLTSRVAHQHPRMKVSGKVSFAAASAASG